jgi:DNA-binding NarL/FixJ family response regulator
MTIVVAIAAAQDIISGGLRSILAQDNTIEVLERFPDFGATPDVVLYDAVGLEADQGAELDTLLKVREWAVIVVGRDLRPDLATRARARGAFGCVSLEADGCEVLATIHSAVARRDENGGLWPDSPDAPDILGAFAQLGPREVDVLAGIAQGLSNAEICAHLRLGHNTVKTYIRTAYRKINVDSRSQAVAWCLQNGFEPPADERAGLRA